MGIALGCMGLGMEDFRNLTLAQFDSIYRAWHEQEQSRYRMLWQQTRIIALYTLMPHSKKKLNEQDIMRFPWEEKCSKIVKKVDQSTQKDFEQIVKLWE